MGKKWKKPKGVGVIYKSKGFRKRASMSEREDENTEDTDETDKDRSSNTSDDGDDGTG